MSPIGQYSGSPPRQVNGILLLGAENSCVLESGLTQGPSLSGPGIPTQDDEHSQALRVSPPARLRLRPCGHISSCCSTNFGLGAAARPIRAEMPASPARRVR